MSATVTPPSRKRIRITALVLTGVALAFYLGIIAILVLRAHR